MRDRKPLSLGRTSRIDGYDRFVTYANDARVTPVKRPIFDAGAEMVRDRFQVDILRLADSKFLEEPLGWSENHSSSTAYRMAVNRALPSLEPCSLRQHLTIRFPFELPLLLAARYFVAQGATEDADGPLECRKQCLGPQRQTCRLAPQPLQQEGDVCSH